MGGAPGAQHGDPACSLPALCGPPTTKKKHYLARLRTEEGFFLCVFGVFVCLRGPEAPLEGSRAPRFGFRRARERGGGKEEFPYH